MFGYASVMFHFICSHKGPVARIRALMFGLIFLLKKITTRKSFNDVSKGGAVSDDAYPLM
jgi:polyferredoxin